MPTWLTNRLCWPIWQLWPTCTRLSILVPAPMRVAWKVPRSIGGAGADLDVVADLDVAQLRHLDVPAVLQAIAEAVGAEDRVGVDDDPVAEDGAVVEDGVGVEQSRRRRAGSSGRSTAPPWIRQRAADDGALADARQTGRCWRRRRSDAEG